MRLRSHLALFGIAALFASCDEDDDSYEWRAKPHAVSPSGWCVAYVQEAKDPSLSGWSAVLLDLKGPDRGQCSATAVEFHRTGVPLEMRWLDPTTLEVRYPKGISPYWPCDVLEHVAQCVGRSVRVVLVPT